VARGTAEAEAVDQRDTGASPSPPEPAKQVRLDPYAGPGPIIAGRLDPSDLRADVAERLSSEAATDADALNAACFVLARSLDEIAFSVPEAEPLAAIGCTIGALEGRQTAGR